MAELVGTCMWSHNLFALISPFLSQLVLSESLLVAVFVKVERGFYQSLACYLNFASISLPSRTMVRLVLTSKVYLKILSRNRLCQRFGTVPV